MKEASRYVRVRKMLPYPVLVGLYQTRVWGILSEGGRDHTLYKCSCKCGSHTLHMSHWNLMGFRIPLCLPLPCLLPRQGARPYPREIHKFLLMVSTLLGDRKTTSMFGVVTMQGLRACHFSVPERTSTETSGANPAKVHENPPNRYVLVTR